MSGPVSTWRSMKNLFNRAKDLHDGVTGDSEADKSRKQTYEQCMKIMSEAIQQLQSLYSKIARNMR